MSEKIEAGSERPARLTDDQVMALLRGDSPLNRARATFSGFAARIEQAGQQRQPIGPIEMRRLEFEAIAAIAKDLGSIGAAIIEAEKAYPGAFWVLGKGRVHGEEKLFGFNLMFGSDEVIAGGEGDDAVSAIRAAVARPAVSA